MTTQIDFRTLPANVPTLCIPRVYPNINESRIRKIFDDFNMGVLERVDIISKNNYKGEKFNRVFIHFRHWNNSENACIARERLLNGKEIQIIYDDPWFWKISAYREPERSKTSRTYDQDASKEHAIRPRLQIDSDEEIQHDRREAPHRKHQSHGRPHRNQGRPHTNQGRPRTRESDLAHRPIAPTLPIPIEDKRRIDSKEEVNTLEDAKLESMIRDQNNDDGPLIIDYGDVPLPPPKKIKRAAASVPQTQEVDL